MNLGFPIRQARFPVHVLVFSGVFLERQYRAFTGHAHGQKTNDFLSKLVGDGYATPITPGALHRGRLYHVQYKPLYEAIGEPNNRHRKATSLGRFVERLMLLDALRLGDGDLCGDLRAFCSPITSRICAAITVSALTGVCSRLKSHFASVHLWRM